jgi:CrcB protein
MSTLEARIVTKTLLAIAIGGACGAVLRYAVVSLVAWWGGHVWGTVLVNLLGSFAIGAIVASVLDAAWFETFGRPFLVVGVLGAFTTFSAFSLDVIQLYGDGRGLLALAYVMATVAGCLLAAKAGMHAAGG